MQNIDCYTAIKVYKDENITAPQRQKGDIGTNGDILIIGYSQGYDLRNQTGKHTGDGV